MMGGVFQTVATGIIDKSYTVTGLTLGINYEFTVDSRNSVGYSESSASIFVFHAIPPNKPSTPTSSNSGQDVILTWSEPSENGAAIQNYQILIITNDGSYVEDLTYCDGTDSTIMDTQSCTVPLSTLTSAPFNLELFADVFITVSATNMKG